MKKKKPVIKDKQYYDRKFNSSLKQSIRKTWMWYGWNRIEILRNKPYVCNSCGYKFQKGEVPQVDHIEPVGIYFDDIHKFLDSMISGKVQLLCKDCHDKKTVQDRNRIKEKRKIYE